LRALLALKATFPLHNIPQQQIDHLKRVLRHGGIAFFIINCYALGKTYILAAKDVIAFYESKPRASIPMKDIVSKGYVVPEGYNPRYDYLSVVIAHFLK
jgi:recombination protein U